jgi:hypothetical protein
MRLATHVICLPSTDELSEGDQSNWQVKTAVDSRWERDKWSTFLQVPYSHDVKSTRKCRMSVKYISCGDATLILRQVPALSTQILARGSRWPTAQLRAARVHLGSFHRNPCSSSEIITSPPPSWGKKFSSLSNSPGRIWDLPSLLLTEYLWLFPHRKGCNH